jgi:hypothetical protein
VQLSAAGVGANLLRLHNYLISFYFRRINNIKKIGKKKWSHFPGIDSADRKAVFLDAFPGLPPGVAGDAKIKKNWFRWDDLLDHWGMVGDELLEELIVNMFSIIVLSNIYFISHNNLI